MKIILNIETAVKTNEIAYNELGTEFALIFGEEARKTNMPTPEETIEGIDNLVERMKNHENVTVIRDEKEITIEINDEIFFMFTNTYIRVMKIMLPLVATFKQVFGLVKGDMKDIVAFANKKKSKKSK